ncbi:hypothetical protein B0A80_03760 [Flavobacterium tructae]|uniref:hypothetical protein n=1 Tax=Flavobacterium TaxID=237 RepID=UPI000B5BDD82|nr:MULTISPECIES: hypothetical protein [Flavobacterium]OXB24844.1 hypothetical protein B0A80_03760 [Flavobacterium tructae]URC11911.1 hypothetical protein M4I44_17670 [Flavobacterium sp. B183]
MKKVTIKELIEFREKNDRTKITFVKNLHKEKIKSEGNSGGDYWISCLSAIRNTFKSDNIDLLDEKIKLLQDKIRIEEHDKNKNQFQKNLDIVNNFKDYDFQHLKPNVDLNYLTQPKDQAIITIKKFPIEAKPCHIYTFSNNGSEEIAGIWFIAQKEGFKKSELGMFTDMIYRYLDKYYSKEFYINPDYCIAVDLFNGHEVNYSQIKSGKIPILIESTLDDLKKFDN